MQASDKNLIAIVGPTGVGKTAFSIRVAKKYNAEIISVDSRQIYAGMDIATGKEVDQGQWQAINNRPTLIIEGVPIHGLNLVSPDQDFSVADWHSVATSLIKQVQSHNKQPILVGGTGFYLSALQGKIDTLYIPQDKSLRQSLETRSTQELASQLQKLDPQTYKRVDKNNRPRLIRAIEIARNQASQENSSPKVSPYNLNMLGLTMDRQQLYKKIDNRIDKMIDQGLITETKKLLHSYDASLASMSGIGYAEMVDYLRGNMSKEQAIRRIKNRNHSYVRRQYTWFRKQPVHWVNCTNPGWQSQADKVLEKFMRAWSD